MPKRLLCKLFIALLVAGVPLQGFAALSAGICRDMQTSSQQSGHARAAPAALIHTHDHGVDAGAGMTHGKDHGSSEKPGAHCAACASCGVTTAIVAALPVLVSDSPRFGVIAHAVSSFVGFVPDGLERPPLTSLA